MKVIFYGGKQSGLISLLTLIALGHEVVSVIPVDETVRLVAVNLGLNIGKTKNINSNNFVNHLEKLDADLFVCCHGKQIIGPRILDKYKAINLHPCLYKYKGAKPVDRLLSDKNKKASVAAHWMTEKVDEGKIIVENFKKVKGETVIEIYNELYIFYAKTLIDALNKIRINPKKKVVIKNEPKK